MPEVASRAVQAVREAVGEDKPFNELGALLEDFTDVRVADSTCQLLQRLAVEAQAATASQESQAPAAPLVGRRLGQAGVCLLEMKGFCSGPACGAWAPRQRPTPPALLPPATPKRAPVLPML